MTSVGRGKVSTNATSERNWARVQVGIDLRVRPVCPRLGLLHHGVAQAKLIGTGGGDELFQRGELGLPAEFTDPAVGQHARPARLDAVQIGQKLLADHLE